MTAADYSSLFALSASELLTRAQQLGLELPPHQERGELLAALLQQGLDAGMNMFVEGIFEPLPEGFGFLRSLHHDLGATPADAYVSPSQVRGLNLKAGHRLGGPIRAPRGTERFFALAHVDSCNGAPPTAAHQRLSFGALQAIVPGMPLVPTGDTDELRLLRTLAPWRAGHRVLIDAPTSAQSAPLLGRLANALHGAANARVMVLLVAQRPELIAALRTQVAAAMTIEVIATTFDQPPARHVATASLALAAAQRAVEAGEQVTLLVDGLTALVRATQLDQPASGRWLCPGLDAHALFGAKQLFAAARAVAEGGTLSVFASVQREVGSAVDAAIATELRAFANSVLVVDATKVDAGEALPFDFLACRTRPEDDVRDAVTKAAAQTLRVQLTGANATGRAALLAALR